MLCDSLVHITNVRFNKEVALNFCQKKSVLLYNKKRSSLIETNDVASLSELQFELVCVSL